jgi:hypothetical protein
MINCNYREVLSGTIVSTKRYPSCLCSPLLLLGAQIAERLEAVEGLERGPQPLEAKQPGGPAVSGVHQRLQVGVAQLERPEGPAGEVVVEGGQACVPAAAVGRGARVAGWASRVQSKMTVWTSATCSACW